ncbi:MAG: hypothetical protein AB1432_11620 [Bacteroidota bacterium]|jgi:hypothetical protein
MKKLFCYLVDFGSVSSGNTYTSELAFASDSDFELAAIRTDLSDTTEADMTITKEGGEQLSNAAISLRAIAGSKNPINLFEKFVVSRGSKWTLSASVSAGTNQPLQVQFWGYKN